ncbi:MAG: hypothetical protein Q9191_002670 [Dirinaria sp. TL-2023a]
MTRRRYASTLPFTFSQDLIENTHSLLQHDDPQAVAEARTADLESQVKELHDFLDINGLVNEAPKSIQYHLLRRPDAVKRHAAQIETAATNKFFKLYAKNGNAKKTMVTSDDLSRAMVPFLRKAEHLLDIPNTAGLVFDLVKMLGEHSYGELDTESDEGRPSDSIVDELLERLAPEKRLAEPNWDFIKDLEELKRVAEKFADYEMENYCPQTIKLLSKWKAASRRTIPKTDEQSDVSSEKYTAVNKEIASSEKPARVQRPKEKTRKLTIPKIRRRGISFQSTRSRLLPYY